MIGLSLIFRFLLVVIILLVVLYVMLPDIYGKPKEILSQSSLDELEKESIDILNKSRIIRDATDQTQEQINNINQNLKK
jgi:predicted PurR-regulated permease PerM